MEKTKYKLDMTLTLRNALPEIFSGWDPMSPEMQLTLSIGSTLPLPGYDHLGRKVPKIILSFEIYLIVNFFLSTGLPFPCRLL